MPMIAGMLGAAIISGGIGASASAGDRAQALKMHQDAIQAWLDVNVPDPESQKLVMQQYVQTGHLAPELEQAVHQGASQFEQIKTDPRMKQAQLKALSGLENIGESGGLTLNDQSNIQKGISDVNSQARGRNEALMNQYAQRGLGGSGLELQAQMMNNQNATNQNSQQQTDVLGSARDRALQAIIQGGQMGGQIRSQDYGEQKDLASARDAINRYNSQNMQDVNTRNVNRGNEAQKYNLDLQQQISNANTEMANKQQQYNKELLQQQFKNRTDIAAGKSQQYGGAAGQYNANASATAKQWAGIGDSINKAGVSYADRYGKQKPTANQQQPVEKDEEDLY